MRSKCQYSPEEIDWIVKYYPEIDRLVALTGRSRKAIKAKAGDLGLATPRAPEWTISENDLIAAYHYDLKKLQSLLPGRTRIAINAQARKLGLGHRRLEWSNDRVELLTKLAGKISDREIADVFGVSVTAILLRRLRLGLVCRQRNPDPKAKLALVEDIIQRAEKERRSLSALAKSLNVQVPRRSMDEARISYRGAAAVVKALGGELYVEWDD